jgi:DNA-directed RNA polymerase subunit RPC12/RpoP
MKVLKAAPTFEPVRATCGHCKAELEIEQSDLVKAAAGMDWRDQCSPYVYATCPCGTRITVKDVPDHIKARLPTEGYGSDGGR